MNIDKKMDAFMNIFHPAPLDILRNKYCVGDEIVYDGRLGYMTTIENLKRGVILEIKEDDNLMYLVRTLNEENGDVWIYESEIVGINK